MTKRGKRLGLGLAADGAGVKGFARFRAGSLVCVYDYPFVLGVLHVGPLCVQDKIAGDHVVCGVESVSQRGVRVPARKGLAYISGGDRLYLLTVLNCLSVDLGTAVGNKGDGVLIRHPPRLERNVAGAGRGEAVRVVCVAGGIKVRSVAYAVDGGAALVIIPPAAEAVAFPCCDGGLCDNGIVRKSGADVEYSASLGYHTAVGVEDDRIRSGIRRPAYFYIGAVVMIEGGDRGGGIREVVDRLARIAVYAPGDHRPILLHGLRPCGDSVLKLLTVFDDKVQLTVFILQR